MRRALILVPALALAVLLVCPSASAQNMERLPRETFDVIPPSERVEGRRGAMRIVQSGCRVGPTHWARRRIVDVAVQEWGVFGFQTIDLRGVRERRLPDGVVPDALNPRLDEPAQDRMIVAVGRWEHTPALAATIAGYWSATPDGASILSRQNRQWRSGEGEINWVEPWSAAFVSWVMCEAGLGEMAQFERDISHRVYIDQAIRARDGERPGAAYVAHDPGEVAIQPGDLLCNSRGGVNYRSLADRRRDLGRYVGSHCDVVVRVGEDTVAVIGGNVLNGVSLTLLPLVEGQGAYPAVISGADLEGARTMFAHLSLQADPVEATALDASPTIRALNP
ncbi:DUF2272 domain-containing protein [Brevundimonas sp.]|uniref:DUF2272 domain-containing protein n=1 Tax=Brevundimonas sp. TaxID=1871086 RepID=UPI001DE13154|nr:DUF2272 domain-containing protein [Brevundimonas sp.]MBL0947390.1 DUF2272 domain-containing protein [Brevundimonas sp.]